MPELCVSCCSVASQGFSPEEVLGVSGKVLMSLVVAPTQVFGGSSCGVSSFMISPLEKWQILFLEMTGKPWRFSTAGSQGPVWLLHSSSAHYEKKQLKKHCPLDTVVLATIPKGAQNLLKLRSSLVHDVFTMDTHRTSCSTLLDPQGSWVKCRLCETEESANHS